VSATYPELKPHRFASGYAPPVVVLTLLILAAILLPAAPAGAAGQTVALAGRPMPEGADEGAVSMLTLAAGAIRTDTYSGRQRVTVRDGDSKRTIELSVSHAPDIGSTVKVQTGEGSGSTQNFSPDDITAAGVVPLDERVVDMLTRNYKPGYAGSGKVAGRPAHIVELRTAKGRLAAKFWLDDLTCLPLRRVVYDSAGQEIRRSEFQSIRVDEIATNIAPAPGSGDELAPEGAPLTGAEVRRLGADGWSTPSALPEGLSLVDSRLAGEGEGQVLHLTYSDGLTTLSVFEQEGRLDTDRLRGWQQERRGGTAVWSWPGAPLSVTWSAHGRVFSVVTDDSERLDNVVAQLPHGPKQAGVLSRMRSGASRLLSWVNPFG
jgi:sigma-E factor negative regulatory protein RseB